MDCFELALVRDTWREILNVAINLRVKRYAEKMLTSCTLVSF
jgi:hypothetical protein